MPDSFTVHAEQYRSVEAPAIVSHAGGDVALIFTALGEEPETLGKEERFTVEDGRVQLSSRGQTSIVLSNPTPGEDAPEAERQKLLDHTRDELDEIAEKAGIDHPERLRTKEEVADAIEAKKNADG